MWYVVLDPYREGSPRPDEECWTLSKEPGISGWNTDGGRDGYGLTKADAEFLARCANEKLAEMLDAFRQDKG